MQVAHQLDGLLRRLAETRPRVDADALMRDACIEQLLRALVQPRAHVGHHIVVDGIVLHGGRRALHMHDHQPRIAIERHLLHGWVGEAGHIVDDRSARFHGTAGHFGMTRIRRYAQALGDEALDHRADAPPFLRRIDLGSSRARRFAAHVDDGGAIGCHLLRMRHRRLHIGEISPIGERVGRDVQNAHDDGRSGVEVVCAAMPDQGLAFLSEPASDLR